MQSNIETNEMSSEIDKKFVNELNYLLTDTFHTILQTEHETIKRWSNTPLSMREIHLIEVVSKSKKGKTISEIAKTFSITLASVTVMVNNLVEKGYLEKLKCDQDGRLIYVILTKKGKEINKVHDKFHSNLMETLSYHMTETEKEVLYQCALRLNEFFKTDVK